MSASLIDSSESSALARMQQQYWTTKQTVFKKLGRKEDDCIIASDLELDLKLELYQTIEESFLTLMRVLELYQERLCVLAQEENALGRFLKENGKQDRTRAGKVMISAGKALSYSAQQRLTLRIPLVRLYQEVETFQYRAIVDTLQTVEKMEKERTAYRGTLMWMKDVSQQLDPDTCKQMEKFRKVQSQVRKSKQRFDKMKLDTLQKVDLLSFSRCNLFSQALATYQNSLLNVSKKIAHSSNSVASVTKGYQHYEFSMLKELTETSKKLAEGTELKEISEEDDKDMMLFFEAEYHDEEAEKNQILPSNRNGTEQSSESVAKKLSSSKGSASNTNEDLKSCYMDTEFDNDILNLNENNFHPSSMMSRFGETTLNNDSSFITDEILLMDSVIQSSASEMSLDGNFVSDWEGVFGTTSRDIQECLNESKDAVKKYLPGFLPSQLLNTSSNLEFEEVNNDGYRNDDSNHKLPSSDSISKEPDAQKEDMKKKQDRTAWFSLFADLDPLANPDLIGEKRGSVDDRNC